MRNNEIKKYEWGETLDGIIGVLQKLENFENNKFNFFDPFLNELINELEKFVSKYIPKENIEIKDKELLGKIEKIKFDYLKIGLFISKIFLENMFTEKEMRNFQNFIKKLCQFRDDIQEFATLCDSQNPDSEINGIIEQCDDDLILKKIEEIKSKYLLLGFLLLKPNLLTKYVN